jgi:hypothetical protein
MIPRTILLLIIISFAALSAIALWQHGYWGIIAPHFRSSAAAQVLSDLVIALSLICTWMWHDAKVHQRVFWPWFALTLITGSFGPLLYLLSAKRRS